MQFNLKIQKRYIDVHPDITLICLPTYNSMPPILLHRVVFLVAQGATQITLVCPTPIAKLLYFSKG